MFEGAPSESGDEIDDTRNGGELGGVGCLGIAKSLGEQPERLDFGERVFDADAKAAQGAIVGALVVCQRMFFRSFERNLGVWMLFPNALIAAVGVKSRAFRQRRTSSPKRKIVNASRNGPRYADNFTLLRDDCFGLDGVAFLFAGIPASLFAARALDGLFRGIDD